MKVLLRRVEASPFSGWLASGIQPCCLRNGTIFSLCLSPCDDGSPSRQKDFYSYPGQSSSRIFLYIYEKRSHESFVMNETPKTNPNAAPAPETVDHTKEAEKLWAADAERHKNQGSKEEGAAAGDEATNYEELTVPDLKDLAHKRGIQISSDMRKDEIIAALEKGI